MKNYKDFNFEEYITKQIIDIVESSYESWLDVCENYPESKDVMANQIALTAQNYFDHGEKYWKEKFKDEPIVMKELNKIGK